MASADPSEWLLNLGEAVKNNGHEMEYVIRVYLQGKEYGHAMPLLFDGSFRGVPVALTHGKRRYCYDNGDEFLY